MRDSLGVTTNNSEQFLMSTLENSKWLEHIRLILDGTLQIVEKIVTGHPVLVHCSDGWDRTAQVRILFTAQISIFLYINHVNMYHHDQNSIF